MTQDDGFTLIELLVVVAIIGILVSICVPQVLRARMSANEAAAIGDLRAISSGQASFSSSCGAGGYATDLADLAKPAPGHSDGFISPDFDRNGVYKSGYTFTVTRNAQPNTVDVTTPSCNAASATRATAFFASATPLTPGSTGTRYFATDTPGTIFVDGSAAIANPIPSGTPPVQ